MTIKVNGLNANQNVTIIAKLNNDRKLFWSHGDFQADQTGTVDLSQQAPTNGTYKGNLPQSDLLLFIVGPKRFYN